MGNIGLMAKYTFTAAQRFAIFKPHSEKCYLCNTPLNLKTTEIDHVIPENLLAKPSKLKNLIETFGLPHDFEINSYNNWMPACRSCNGKKLTHIFEPTPLIQFVLENAAKKSKKVEAFLEEAVGDRRISGALNVLSRASEMGELSDEDRRQLVPLVSNIIADRSEEEKDEPVRLTPLYEVLHETNWIRIIRGRYGVGARPVGDYVHSSFDCQNCGPNGAWSGARCVVCGQMDDD